MSSCNPDTFAELENQAVLHLLAQSLTACEEEALLAEARRRGLI